MRREWQCSCGRWLNYEYGRCTHVKNKELSLTEMIAAREGSDVADLYGAPEISHEWRTPQHAVREFPDG